MGTWNSYLKWDASHHTPQFRNFQLARMILRHHYVLLILASLALAVYSDVLETSVLSTPEVASLPATSEVETKPSKLERRSSFNGDVRGASNLDSRIQSTLQTIREKIPEAVDSVEDDIAVANRDRVILALSNFLGMVFGVLKTTGNNWNFEDLGTGDRIQVIAQILYGYGYWAPFAFEFEKARVDCGAHDLEKTLTEYGYVTT